MRIDQPGQDNLPAQVEDQVRGRRQLGSRADLLDDAIHGKNSGVFQFPSRTIHGDEDFGVSSENASHSARCYSIWRERESAGTACLLVSEASRLTLFPLRHRRSKGAREQGSKGASRDGLPT